MRPAGPPTVIIGLGITGYSCLRHLAGRRPLTVLDTRDVPPNEAAARAGYPDVTFRFGAESAAFAFDGVAEVIVSPGIGLDHCLVQRALAAGARVQSDIDLFCDAVQAAGGAPIHAVTGTNGKSTVTALVGHLLHALGHNPGVGGNLGEPALDLLDTPRDCYVLELSSFQLERMRAQPFAAATILNVTEDHLDRHGDMAAYTASKQRIYRDARRAVVNRHDPRTAPTTAVAACVTFGLDAPAPGQWGLIDADGCSWLACGPVRLMTADALPIAGRHNALNVLAALAMVAPADIAVNTAAQRALADGIRTFSGLPHRCQPVGEYRGIRFVDDSKATNVGATIAALEGLGDPAQRRLVLIAGGDGKGADFAPLVDPVNRYVKGLVLLGRDAPRLADTLAGTAPIVRVADMPAAVTAAAAMAEAGDTVLLAPACASLDMFRNFAARGAAFAAAVEALR
ncbi:MAG: UDP-N-acetylmuramoyl-L-alanine--D-glutamate ligase [Pseudomonadales bacterium]|nr:UDP-N-acetylmuramoyl-L-alanine--D-glutamate ligase [Pseudomonadales bacterium]